MKTPRVEFNLDKIAHNTRTLVKLYEAKGIRLMGVTKVVSGNPAIARVLLKNGVKILADSRIQNIRKMRRAGIEATFVLLRSPSMSQALDVVKYVDISHNTEMSVLQKLSEIALKRGARHKVILMVELGDLREGIMPADVIEFTREVLKLKGIKLSGIGANLACYGGIAPDEANMEKLSSLAGEIEFKLKIKLKYVSGGSSANYNWARTTKNTGRINYFRMGEAIFLGVEPLQRKAIPKLFPDAFTLIAEVIESKTKPSLPYGTVCQDSFGNIQHFGDEGLMHRMILGIGSQDMCISGLSPRNDIKILGASSDHLLINRKEMKIKIGQEIYFDMNYSALLSAMNSSYVKKTNSHEQ